jgi:siroheme synthase-like protein
MGYLPVILDLTGRRAVVVGGGAVAERKVAALVRAGARVIVIAPSLSPGLDRLVRGAPTAVAVERRPYRSGDLEGAWVAFAATDDSRVQEEVAQEAARRAVWLNAVDDPLHCSLLMPAILERGLLQIAVSTGGASPALASRVRDDLGVAMGPEYAQAAEHLAALRGRYAAGDARRQAFARLLDAGLLEALRRGDLPGVARMTELACRDLVPADGGEG